jgi:GNAT superfamily N-acetyltransferase
VAANARSQFEVREARVADGDQLAGIFARAYEHDPLLMWILPEEATRARVHQQMTARNWRYTFPHRVIYTTDPAASVAVWAAPGRWQVKGLDSVAQLPALLLTYGPRALARAARVSTVLAAHHPSEPHWYLEGLATDPAAQRRGGATAVLEPVLNRCDQDDVAAYLETQVEALVPFYARQGFDVRDSVSVGDDIPMWLMWRRPREL